MQAAIVDGVNQLGGAGQSHLLEHELGEQCRRSTTVELADDGGQRGATDPETATLIAEQIAPPTRTRRPANAVARVRDRSSPGDDDDTRRVAGSGDKSDEGVIHDNGWSLESDTAHDGAHRYGVRGPIDTGDPQTNRSRTNVSFADGFLHHMM